MGLGAECIYAYICAKSPTATFYRLQATEEKAKVEAEAAACLTRLSLAERLVGGLSSENERWGNEIEKLRNSATTLVGDCMLASGFVSYVGAFDQANRDILWKNVWTPGKAREGADNVFVDHLGVRGILHHARVMTVVRSVDDLVLHMLTSTPEKKTTTFCQKWVDWMSAAGQGNNYPKKQVVGQGGDLFRTK